MSVTDIILHLGAVSAVYFLTTMLLALIREEPGATLKAWGLGVSLTIMVIAAAFRPTPDTRVDPTFRHPPRVPAVELRDHGFELPGDGAAGRP